MLNSLCNPFGSLWLVKMLKHGDLILVEGSRRHWVVLNVTKRDLKMGVNAPCPGLYGFGGMWYGRKVFNYKSYGKIQNLDGVKIIEIGKARSFSIRDIKGLTD